MNCKQGDLAIVIHCPPAPDAIGRIVECLAFRGPYRINGVLYENVWEVRWGDNDARSMTGHEGWGAPDAWMRPIKNPGDEERDESEQWLPPVPARERETA